MGTAHSSFRDVGKFDSIGEEQQVEESFVSEIQRGRKESLIL